MNYVMKNAALEAKGIPLLALMKGDEILFKVENPEDFKNVELLKKIAEYKETKEDKAKWNTKYCKTYKYIINSKYICFIWLKQL